MKATLLLIARWFIIIVAVEYAIVGGCLIIAGQKGLGWSYICYSAASVALFFASMGI